MYNFWAGLRCSVKALPFVFAKGTRLTFHTSHERRARAAAVIFWSLEGVLSPLSR